MNVLVMRHADVARLTREPARSRSLDTLRGELQAYKIGKEWRIRRDHFDEAMEARRVSTEPTQSGGLWDPDAA